MKLRDRFKAWLSRHERLERFWHALWRQRRKIRITIFLVAHLLGALTTVKAIMETRTAQGAVAWAVSLNTIPYVAVPAYWVFGRSDFNGYVTARRTHREELEDFWTDFEETLREKGLAARKPEDRIFVLEELAKLPVTRGNDAELLIDGEETFDSIIEGIGRAEDYVLVQFYIIHDDGVGRDLRDALVERAEAGVRCLLLYDEVGSDFPPEYLASLHDAGVQAHSFNTTQGDANRFQLNFRNHRKIVVVDGKEAWVGGLNVGDEYKGLVPKFGFWRDTHIRVEGPVVQSVQVSFVEDWHWAVKEILNGLNWDPEPAASGADMGMACLPTGPVDPYETCTLFFLHAIHSAEQRLWIASPYFVPDPQFISALQLAALRGVDVRILIPDVADSALVNLSAWSFVPELQKAGIEIHRYTKGFMHHKVTLIDERYCTIGTANFDNRSFRLNFEITIGVDDPGFNTEVAEMLEADFAESRLLAEGDYESKSGWFRFWSRMSRLTAPIQ